MAQVRALRAAGVLGEVDRIVAVSDRRRRADAATSSASRRVDVVENGVDTALLPARARRRRDPAPSAVPRAASTGGRTSTRVALLLDDVFPAVRAAEPGATLRLVGRNPPDWLPAGSRDDAGRRAARRRAGRAAVPGAGAA